MRPGFFPEYLYGVNIVEVGALSSFGRTRVRAQREPGADMATEQQLSDFPGFRIVRIRTALEPVVDHTATATEVHSLLLPFHLESV